MTEIAPGVDIERDVLTKVAIPLAVAANVRTMDERVFRNEPMGLLLKEAEPRAMAVVRSNGWVSSHE